MRTHAYLQSQCIHHSQSILASTDQTQGHDLFQAADHRFGKMKGFDPSIPQGLITSLSRLGRFGPRNNCSHFSLGGKGPCEPVFK